MPSWRWIATPGHTAGHVSLFRESDRTLLAGDAVVTTDLDAWSSQFTWPRELSRPPTPLTPDWHAARDSIRRLADVDPRTIASGHGLPIRGRELGHELHVFADTLREPQGGRYANDPVRYASDGSVAELPPPVADLLPRNLAIGAAVLLAAAAVLKVASNRNSYSCDKNLSD